MVFSACRLSSCVSTCREGFFARNSGNDHLSDGTGQTRVMCYTRTKPQTSFVKSNDVKQVAQPPISSIMHVTKSRYEPCNIFLTACAAVTRSAPWLSAFICYHRHQHHILTNFIITIININIKNIILFLNNQKQKTCLQMLLTKNTSPTTIIFIKFSRISKYICIYR